MTVPNRTKPDQKLAFTPHDCRDMLSLGRDKVYALIRSGELGSIRVGRRLLIPREAITDFLKGQK